MKPTISLGHLEIVRLLQKNVPPNGRVLDAGAWPGTLCPHLQHLKWSVVAFDKDPNRRQKITSSAIINGTARESIGNTQSTVDNLTFAEAMLRIGVECIKVDLEADRFPLESDSLDAITLTEVIEHLWVNPLFALAEMNRCLKKGGVLALSTPNLLSLRNRVNFVLGRIDHVIEHPFVSFYKQQNVGHFGHLRLYAPQELSTLLELFGFDSSIYYRSLDYNDMVQVPWLYREVAMQEHPNSAVVGQRRTARVFGKLRRSPKSYWDAALATSRYWVEQAFPQLRPHLFIVARKIRDADYESHSLNRVEELVRKTMGD